MNRMQATITDAAYGWNLQARGEPRTSPLGWSSSWPQWRLLPCRAP